MNAFLLRNAPGLTSSIRKAAPYILLLGALTTIAFVPRDWVVPSAIAWAGVALAMIAWAYYCSHTVAKKFDGRVVAFVFSPTPIGSLCTELENQGVPIDDIKLIKLMSSNLAYTKRYLASSRNGDEPFDSTLERCKDMNVVYCGYADDPDIRSERSRVTFIRTDSKRTEHVNLIYTRTRGCYVWYEPFHDNNGDREYFGGGAYLIALTPKGLSQAEEIFDDFASSNSSKKLVPKAPAYATGAA
jgi:hypothetical protein